MASWREAFDLGDRTPPAAEPIRGDEQGAGVLSRLREGLGRSRRALQAELAASVSDRIDEQTWERLEEALILADVGAPATADVVARLEREADAGEISSAESLRARLVEVLADVAGPG